jgi:hypothetical protein
MSTPSALIRSFGFNHSRASSIASYSSRTGAAILQSSGAASTADCCGCAALASPATRKPRTLTRRTICVFVSIPVLVTQGFDTVREISVPGEHGWSNSGDPPTRVRLMCPRCPQTLFVWISGYRRRKPSALYAVDQFVQYSGRCRSVLVTRTIYGRPRLRKIAGPTDSA